MTFFPPLSLSLSLGLVGQWVCLGEISGLVGFVVVENGGCVGFVVVEIDGFRSW